MEYKFLTDTDIQFFRNLIGTENVLISDFEIYASDATEKLEFFPDIVLKPHTSEEISEIVKYCHKELLPITPRGAGTGLAGGALPVKGGVLLSVERMHKILDIDTKNFQVTVEAGVINFNLQQALFQHNLFFPPDPSSWQSSLIGGNIATNAGGPKAVKYGVTSNYVLNLEVVLPNGEIIWTGANTLKNSTGLNLTQLFVGSEGTLGIITKAVLKVMPQPKFDVSMLVPFRNLYEACDAVSEIMYAGLNPAALEFMEKNAIQITTEYLEQNSFLEGLNKDLFENNEAHLLIMFDGNSFESIMNEAQKTAEVLGKFDIGEILFADAELEKERIWKIRRRVAEIVKMNGYTIEEDTVVPRANLAKLVEGMHKLANENDYKVVCYGHAGDGNLHVRINHPIHKNSYNNPEIQIILKKLFEEVKKLGGTISGEHGIGLIQKSYLPIVFSQANLDLQKSIKQSIDPKNIMNPGKVWI
ncbi:FAD-binding oxidoreductase [Moheibacter sediminis]|uniref:Glycolate oxidase n=1 Tax=Moheibacter sediminis TaxID=1434700 RepID=A0A1W2CVH8_9FLAO|nr:FAD-linked oxidase C-terminal domain-containing protein [Moheibacter sediminis]SMC88718.1 glycolate oxidase [Moheibacter sediminis]